jgi:retinol-binding protein 3
MAISPCNVYLMKQLMTVFKSLIRQHSTSCKPTRKKYNCRQARPIGTMMLLIACLLHVDVQGQSNVLSKKEVQAIVTALADSVKSNYVEEGTAGAIHAQLNKLLREGAYEGAENSIALAALLSKQLIALSNDKHFGVDFTAATTGNVQRRMPSSYNHLAPYNYYFNKMEILPGNIGLLEIGQFVPTDYTGQLIVAAMNFFANSDALIIDLRNCIGGDPRTVLQLAGCFFREPVLFEISHNRGANTSEEFWTTKTGFQATEKGKIAFTNNTEKEIKADYSKLATMPVYVLTSNATFSAGEVMAHGLQTRQRAKTVGETTGHGGNGIRPFALPHGFVAFIPFAQMVSPVNGKGFQLTGVVPDIATTPAKALDTAYIIALRQLVDNAADEAAKNRLNWEMRLYLLRKQGGCKADVQQYAGLYGEREVILVEGELYYQREGGTNKQLQPLTEHHFLLDRQTIVEFSSGGQSIIVHQMNGSEKRYDRTNKNAKLQ